MEIQFEPHTLECAEELCTNETEIKDVIHTGFPIPTKYNRIGKAEVHDFKRNSHNKYYEKNGWRFFISSKEIRLLL